MSSVRFIQYIFINDVQYMLTSSIFSSNILIESADYHLQTYEWDRVCQSYLYEPQKRKPLSYSALPDDWHTAVTDSTLLPYTSHTWKETEAIVLLNNLAQY